MHNMHTECTLDAFVLAQNLTIKLQKDLINCHPFFTRQWTCPECMWDVSGMRLGCVRVAFQTSANITLELSCTIGESLHDPCTVYLVTTNNSYWWFKSNIPKSLCNKHDKLLASSGKHNTEFTYFLSYTYMCAMLQKLFRFSKIWCIAICSQNVKQHYNNVEIYEPFCDIYVPKEFLHRCHGVFKAIAQTVKSFIVFNTDHELNRPCILHSAVLIWCHSVSYQSSSVWPVTTSVYGLTWR